MDVRLTGRQLAKARATAVQVGPHPIRLGLLVQERALAARRLRRLRSGYPDWVVDAPAGASLRPVQIDLPLAIELPLDLQGPAEEIRSEAECVLNHRVDYLGSGMVDLGPAIDWHQDFKSGSRWPRSFYQDVDAVCLDDSSDPKVPWELSRGHQLLTLARAARLYHDERFASELEVQLNSWLEENRPGYGINWVNAMEIAIRSVNWIWAIGTLEHFRPLDSALRGSVTRSLQTHGRHIASNLEGSRRLRNNHYVADLLGLLALGASIGGDPLATKWLRFAQRELERQIVDQVLPDGVSFEASLPYHGLALEMFLLAWHISA
jgi:Heparinase II/III N-terminus